MRLILDLVVSLLISLQIEINRENKYEVENIMNRRDVRGKPKYLVR